jgi:hypothetical protein
LSTGHGPEDYNTENFDENFDDGFGTSGTEGLLLPPWERRERFGFLNGLYLTIKDVLLTPRNFFHRMPSQMGLAQPLYFALVIGVVAAFFSWMWSLAGSSLEMLFTDDLGDVLQGPISNFMIFLFSPVIVAIQVFIWAAIIHVVLMLVGGDKLGFEATFRVVAYGEAAAILAIVPGCGTFFGVLWSLFITIVGLYSIHETDPWKSVVAVVAPMFLCFSTFAGSIVMLMLAID